MPDVAALLLELTRGTDDPDVVAEELRKRGVRGVRGDGYRCPLARALEQKGVLGPALDEDGARRVGVRDIVGLPAGALSFLHRFDDGGTPTWRPTMPDDLTPDERLVWAATFGAYFGGACLRSNRMIVDGKPATGLQVFASARGSADLAVEGLREMKERDDDRS